jgi:hypothetical protein
MLAAVVVAAGCGGSDEVTSAPAEGTVVEGTVVEGIVELASLDPITQRFDADRGKPRLLLILSPT